MVFEYLEIRGSYEENDRGHVVDFIPAVDASKLNKLAEEGWRVVSMHWVTIEEQGKGPWIGAVLLERQKNTGIVEYGGTPYPSSENF